jgi:hypothetical protein
MPSRLEVPETSSVALRAAAAVAALGAFGWLAVWTLLLLISAGAEGSEPVCSDDTRRVTQAMIGLIGLPVVAVTGWALAKIALRAQGWPRLPLLITAALLLSVVWWLVWTRC